MASTSLHTKKPSLDAFRSFTENQTTSPPPNSNADSNKPNASESRRSSVTSSVGGSLDYISGASSLSRLRTVTETNESFTQNAISTLLQPPIIRTGLLPHVSAPTSALHKPPNSRDIPPVILSPIKPIDHTVFRPYMSEVASLYDAHSRAEQQQQQEQQEQQQQNQPQSQANWSGKPNGSKSDDGLASGSASPRDTLSPKNSILSLPTIAESPSHLYTRRKSSGPIRKSHLAVPSLSSIPNVYFDEAFHLENPRIFDVVTEKSEVIRTPAKEEKAEAHGPPRRALATNAILQEKLSWYLDTVEIHLISAISTASKSFFAALGSLKELHREASDSVIEIQRLRADLKHLDEDMAMGRLELVKLNQRKQNLYKLACATQQLQNVVKAASYCEDLVGQGELGGSLEKITHLEEYICGYYDPDPGIDMTWLNPEPLEHLVDLRRLKALDGFDRGMSQLRERIGMGYQHKFTEILLSDLRNHINGIPVKVTLSRWSATLQRRRGLHTRTDSSGPLVASNELREKLSETLFGLKRSKYTLAATAAFRDAVSKEIKKIIRHQLPSASDDDAESVASTSTRSSRIALSQQEKSSILARNLRALDATDAEELLSKAYCGVAEALRRLQFQFKLLLDISSDQKSPVRTQFMGHLDAIANGARSVSPNPQEEISQALDLSSLLGQAVDVAQSQLIKVLKVRSDQVINLELNEFLRYFTLNKLFADECEAITGRSGASLKGVINNQITDFITRFSEAEKSKLSDAMERDRWDAYDFNDNDTKTLNHILECMNIDPPSFLRQAYVFDDESTKINGANKDNGILTRENSVTKIPTGLTRPAIIDNDSFILPHSVVLLLHGISRFCTLIACIPAITSEVSLSLLDYCKLFNSKSCQLILGAGATKSAARLDKINTKHLALASQALAFAVALIPYIREFVRRKPGINVPSATTSSISPSSSTNSSNIGSNNSSSSSSTTSGNIAEYDRVRRLLTDHMISIHDKLIDIMTTRAAVHQRAMDATDWSLDPGRGPTVPSRHMETATKETASLARVLAKHMPEASVRGIVVPVMEAYRDVFGEAFRRAVVTTPEAKERLVRDAEAFLNKLGGLHGGKQVGESLVEIAKAKEVTGGDSNPVNTNSITKNGSMHKEVKENGA